MTELTDEQCDAIYRALHEWATSVDNYDFGLPMVAGGGAAGAREVIRAAIAAHGAANAVQGEPAYSTEQVRYMVEGAWCAGYYEAGYTHGSEYAEKKATACADEFLGAGAPQPAIHAGVVLDENVAFEAGWRTAAMWAKRDDLYSDTASAAYKRDRDAVLAQLRLLLEATAMKTDREMTAVADKFAHRMAMHLECILLDYGGEYWDEAMQTLGEYRSAMNEIHERESPTFMGEPAIEDRSDCHGPDWTDRDGEYLK